MSETFTVTVKEIVDAAAKNGLAWRRGGWFGWDDKSQKESACIMGQAFYNLTGLTASNNDYAENGAENMIAALDSIAHGIGSVLIGLNDNDYEKTYEDLVAEFKAGTQDVLDKVVTFVLPDDEDFEDENYAEEEDV